METQNYKRTVAGSVGAGMAAVFNGSGRQYYILEHKTESVYHHAGESQKIIVDQIELGRDSSCQVRFDESFETVSRRHAAIVKDGDGWKLITLSQTNPTFVNGQPIQGEWKLSSGDEIRLSSKGPLMGFIVPQGKQSLVSSIGMTERLNLFRQQALRPYKRALWILCVVLILAIAGLVTWNVLQGKKFDKQIQDKQEQIREVQDALIQSDAEISVLNDALIEAEQKSAAEKARVQRQLQQAQEERDLLLNHARGLRDELQDAVDNADKANQKVEDAQKEINSLNDKINEIASKPDAGKTEQATQKVEPKSQSDAVRDAIRRRTNETRPKIQQ
ncbi:MAG: FHA domain-containing protein [Bacteroidales bacterium]|nr:FHA domain-containing protein [Bacteroidales bacterium]